MGVMNDEKILIYCAMTRSNKSGLLEGLTTEKDTIDNFVEWLRASFGPTQGQQRMSFQSMRQGANESEMDFFIRCEKSYFRSRGMAKPNGNNFSQYMKEDIRHGFLTGLRNKEVKRLLWVNNSSVDYEEIARLAKTYATSLVDIEKVYNVNRVSQENWIIGNAEKGAKPEPKEQSKAEERISGLEKKLEDMVLQIENSSQARKRDAKCFKCGYYGHFQNECMASDKTRSKFNRSRSNSREGARFQRSSSRDRYQRNRGRSPYPRQRSVSPRQSSPRSYRGRSRSPGWRMSSPWRRDRSRSHDRYRVQRSQERRRSPERRGSPDGRSYSNGGRGNSKRVQLR